MHLEAVATLFALGAVVGVAARDVGDQVAPVAATDQCGGVARLEDRDVDFGVRGACRWCCRRWAKDSHTWVSDDDRTRCVRCAASELIESAVVPRWVNRLHEREPSGVSAAICTPQMAAYG